MIRCLTCFAAAGLAGSLFMATALIADADEPDAPSVATAESSKETIAVQLAKSRLKLAEVELQRALQLNERASVYTAVTIELLRRNVDICQSRLDGLLETPGSDLHAVHLRELESDLKIAEHQWEYAVQLRERFPGAMHLSQPEALRLRTEVARLALANARDPSHVATPQDHMQWQLDVLRQQMIDLTLRVETLKLGQ